jgi:hypothetical protein
MFAGALADRVTDSTSRTGRPQMESTVRKVLVSVGLFATVTFGLAASASAAPNPNPNAPAHTGTACVTVLSHNPNTGPGGHISPTGADRFGAVGAALCGLST